MSGEFGGLVAAGKGKLVAESDSEEDEELREGLFVGASCGNGQRKMRCRRLRMCSIMLLLTTPNPESVFGP